MRSIKSAIQGVILAAALLWGFQIPAFSQSDDDFWLLDEFIAAHSEQAGLSEAFNQIIRDEAMSLKKAQSEPVHIVIIYPGLQASDYWRRSVSSFKARMDEIGISYELKDHFTKPGTDIRLQNQLIGQAMKSDPDYLVFTLDALRHRGIIERVMAKGKTKVILQNITTPLRIFDQQQPFLYVGFDHGMGAQMLANRYREIYPKGAKYAVFYGPRGYVSRMRGGVFLQEMAQQSSMELVASYYVNFDRDRSYRAAKELLAERPDLDFIYACSTDIALGIIDALKEAGKLGQVKVNGWGGGSAELDAIEKGELNFTVMRMNDDNGVAMAEAVRLATEGRASLVPTVYSGDFRMVDQETSSDELAKMRKHAFRYSN